MVQSRSLFRPEERDNTLYNIAMKQDEQAADMAHIREAVTEIRTALLGIPNTDDKGLCGRVHLNEKRQTDFEKRVAGLGVGVILALMAGVFALIT